MDYLDPSLVIEMERYLSVDIKTWIVKLREKERQRRNGNDISILNSTLSPIQCFLGIIRYSIDVLIRYQWHTKKD